MRKLTLSVVFVCLFFLVVGFKFPLPLRAGCNPPADYSDCPVSPFGSHLAGNLLDEQYQATRAQQNFAELRSQAEASDPANSDRQIQATVIISTGMVRDASIMNPVLAAANEYGIHLTLTLEVAPDEAKSIGESLQNELAAAGMLSSANVEINQEPNLSMNGIQYGAILSQFALGCDGCKLFLPALGGPPTDETTASKKQFISDFAQAYPTLFNKTAGIAFNSYAGDPQGAVTDWLASYDMWKEAAAAVGQNIDGKVIFLTEAGPPGGDPNWPDIDNFLNAMASAFEELKRTDPRFKNVEGFTYFLWLGDGNQMVITYADGQTKVVKRRLINQGRNLEVTKIKSGNPTKPLQKYSDESEVACDRVVYGVPNAATNMYRTKTGQETPSMRTDANLNWNGLVKGTHCGQVKSQPIVLKEVAPFAPDEGDLCKTVGWMGEITFNYGSNDNFRIPFAEEIADHWAGTWDAEHMKESDIEKRTKDAALPPTTSLLQKIQSILGVSTERKLLAQTPSTPNIPSQFGQASVNGQPYTGSVDTNGELNPSLFNENSVNEGKGLVACDYPEGEPPDPEAPQLSEIVGTDPNNPDAFTGTYQIAGSAKNWPVEVLGLKATPGQEVSAPGGGHDIGGGYRYMVLRADENSVTLTNTRQDYSDAPVAELGGPGMAGYTVYISGVHVDPSLLASYERLDSEGRKFLPVLSASQHIGTASGDEVRVTVRDSMDFMDVRSKFDWWQAYPDAPAGQCKGGTGKRPSKRAPYDLFGKSGVLKKLVSQDVQDSLKCSLIKFVRNKGNTSVYTNFAIEGTKLTDIPCPPTVDNPKASMTDYTNWQKSWGSKWAKMSLIPNEKTIGTLKLALCGDRQYDTTIPYPETFRLGLAANELFKIYTAQDSIKTYYKNNNDTYNLMLPVDKNQALAYVPPDSLPDENSEQLAAVSPLSESTPDKKEDLSDLLTTLAGKVKEVLGLLKIPALLAQVPAGQITVTPQTNVESGKINYSVTIQTPVDGHFITELWIDGEKSGIGVMNLARAGGSLTYGTPGMVSGDTAVFPVLSGDHQIQFMVKCDDCNIPGQQGQPLWSNCTISAGTSSCGQSGPPTPSKPSGPQCNETPQCQASCNLCGRSQLMPSDTTIWNASYPANHVVVGKSWNGNDYDAAPVELTWWIPKWDGTFAHLPIGCQVLPVDDPGAQDIPVYTDPSTGETGRINCNKVNMRVVDVYNSVPFLASAWNQAASAGGGTTPGGFLNVFKPKCDPKDPNSICSHPAIANNNVGCTTNQSFVLDGAGNFSNNPGASLLNYGLGVTNANGVSVSQESPGSGEKAKVLFYRIGGLCNADQWVSGKVLNTK
jgi:hypothetical protein